MPDVTTHVFRVPAPVGNFLRFRMYVRQFVRFVGDMGKFNKGFN